MKPGTTVILRNAKIDMFKGSMRLAVDKWGRVEVTEPSSFTVKEDNNLSLVEYELVNVAEEWNSKTCIQESPGTSNSSPMNWLDCAGCQGKCFQLVNVIADEASDGFNLARVEAWLRLLLHQSVQLIDFK